MNSALHRLRMLRQQAGTPSPAVPAQPLPDSVLRAQRIRQGVAAALCADRGLPGVEIECGLQLIEHHVRLDPQTPPPVLCGHFDRGEPICRDDVLFFDTETTGLAGGTGTRAFMIGASQWTDNGCTLQVRQLLISSMSAERAMLSVFRQWLTPGTVLCTYNGKSYDAPLLRSRFRLAQQQDPFVGLRHVDLLYPARRQYRDDLENCRLGTIERHVLDIVRDDDLPGSQAPAAWLTYLRGGSALNLTRVAAHNLQDVVTLARLLPHLSEIHHVSRYSLNPDCSPLRSRGTPRSNHRRTP